MRRERTILVSSPSGREHLADDLNYDTYCGTAIGDDWGEGTNVTGNVEIDAPGLCKKCREVMLR